MENWGIPAVAVATHEFMLPARAQAAALGRPDFDAGYVAHPIQDQTGAEIAARGDDGVRETAPRRNGQADRLPHRPPAGIVTPRTFKGQCSCIPTPIDIHE